MELLGGNAHLAAKAELTAVGEPGGSIEIHRRTVHTGCELPQHRFILCHHRFAVARGMGGNMGNRFAHTADALDRQNVVQKFRVEIRFARRCAGDDSLGHLVQPQLHLCADAVMELGKKFRCDFLVNQQHFLRVAHAGAAGFGIFDDGQGHVLIGAFIHIHMADAGAGGDAGDSGILHAGIDQSRAAPGDQ